VKAAPGETAKTGFDVTVPASWKNPLARVAIAVDVMADGKYLGQIAEAVVDIQEPRA
jgi:hypothetical protein